MKHSFYIFGAIFIAGAVIAGFFLVWPKYEDLVSANSEIEIIKERMEKRDDYLDELRGTSRKLDDYEEELKLVDAALYNDPWLPHLYDYFIKLAAKKGVNIEGINSNVLTKGEDSNFREIFLSLEVNGDYLSFKNFLAGIESSSRIFDIQNINLDGRVEDSELMKFSLNLITRSY
jgi:Tfp pilus assembly protein PilO